MDDLKLYAKSERELDLLYPGCEDFFWWCWYGIWSGQVCRAGLEEGKGGSNRGNWITPDEKRMREVNLDGYKYLESCS